MAPGLENAEAKSTEAERQNMVHDCRVVAMDGELEEAVEQNTPYNNQHMVEKVVRDEAPDAAQTPDPPVVLRQALVRLMMLRFVASESRSLRASLWTFCFAGTCAAQA